MALAKGSHGSFTRTDNLAWHRGDQLFSLEVRSVPVVIVAVIVAQLSIGHGAPRPHELERPALQTSWPAHVDCPRFARIEISVDDRVQAIEWRGHAAASRLFYPAPAGKNDDARDHFTRGARSFPCGDENSLCLLYPRRADRSLHSERSFLAARLSEPLPADFPVGNLAGLALRPDPRHLPSRKIGPSNHGFGLRLVLRCSDPSRPSLYWACDKGLCILRTFRSNPEVRDESWRIHGPYQKDWGNGRRARDLERLLDAPSWALRKQNATLKDLARDLLEEMAMVIDRGCANRACSSRIDRLRAAVAGLRASRSLALGQVGARSAKDREFALEETGWVARLGDSGVRAEVACARHYHHETGENRPHDYCRLGILGRSARLGDYFPDFQQIELPDGGSIELRGTGVRFGLKRVSSSEENQIVITGSALATAVTN